MIALDTVLAVVVLLSALALFVVAGYAEKLVSTRWRALYCLPASLCLILMGAAGFELCMMTGYIGAAVLLVGFIWENVKVRRGASIAAALLAVLCFPICESNMGYRLPDFAADFRESFAVMKDHYVLTEHKEIDWDALYDEYHPRFQQADTEGSEKIAQAAWNSFCAEFYDGHVGFMPSFEDHSEEFYGNDYGLMLMRLSDGSIAAVGVEPDSAVTEAGIHNGTIVTSWDGMDPVEASKKSEMYEQISYTDKDIAEFYSAMLAAGVGDSTVDVSFIADNGEEKTVTLSKMGKFIDRMDDTLAIISQGVEVGNLEWAEIDENTVCLRIKSMMYDTKAATDGNYSRMKNNLYAEVEEYKAAGYTNLVIDLRSNGGGASDVVKVIGELFAPVGEHYYATDGKWDDTLGNYVYNVETGEYAEGEKHYFTGENTWDSNPIVLLVNAGSASAADHLAMVMRGMDNVTVMGFTEPNGSAQGVAGYTTESGMLAFSCSLLLDENGDVFIDSDTDMESGDDLDIKVPFDSEAIKVLFEDGEDYLMNKAIEHMSK